MKIKSKLYIDVGISILLFAAFVSVIAVTSRRIVEEDRRRGVANDVSTAISELDIVTYEYLIYHEQRMKKQWESKYESIAAILETAEAATVATDEEMIKSIGADYSSLGILFSQVVANYENVQRLTQSGASEEKIVAGSLLGERLVAQLLVKSHSILTDASRLAEAAHLREVRYQRLSARLTTGLMVVLVIAITILSLLIVRSISKPLGELILSTNIIGMGDLEHRVEVMSRDELGDLTNAFNQMTKNLKEVTASRDDLDKEVAERSRAEEGLRIRSLQLEASNKELETFSYSVSHDLRAPLRGIDGFSQVLLEDCGDKLDAKEKDYLQRVRKASQRMAILIDDLLGLSRVTRREMRREGVDLSRLAEEIVEDIRSREPERQAEFIIQPALVVQGDPDLLRIVLEKLLENAWKFTGRHATARIEFGTMEAEAEKAYFVRDDGAGFDQKYTDKLFGAFQRLHTTEEFGGTGIGLATVNRIIRRHGGRAWAEGRVDKGATFYFTLSQA